MPEAVSTVLHLHADGRLDAALPSVQVQPPAGWKPREQREAEAAQQAQRGTAGAASDGR